MVRMPCAITPETLAPSPSATNKRLTADATPTFLALSSGPAEKTDDNVAVLEHFTILLYDGTSDLTSNNEAQKELFTKKGRAMDAIPPTRGALVQHIKRSVYQGGNCWGQATAVAQKLPSLMTRGGLNHLTGNRCGPQKAADYDPSAIKQH